MRKNKKATIQDLFVLTILMTAFAVSILFSINLYTSFKNVQASNPELQTNYTNSTNQKIEQGFTTFDNLIFFGFFLMAIIAIALAATIPTEPVFFVITLIFFFIAIFLSIVCSNLVGTFAASTAFAANAVAIPKTLFLLDKLPFFIFGIGIILLFVMYAKLKK